MPSVCVLHSSIDHMNRIHCQCINQSCEYQAIVHYMMYPCTNITTRPCRKSRIVGCVEEVHKSVDTYCIDRLGHIQAVKERHAFNLKKQACCAVRCIHIVVDVMIVYTNT